ncbi:hypothetical protein [Rhizobium laguerreae]|uniref:hypothetical protein n=1 Tax=Rhizobium laguerreae TaxID=1076926 RepID=UPI001C917D48|nr:hypothetical protein [Rhizobium laguerreae]MBY3167380.1 hypothetical protein [Rhizobium laguerreae]
MGFERQVRERIEDVLNGNKRPEEIPGATSVRCATGLVLRSLEGITTLSESDAWDYLDSGNVTITQNLRSEYWERADKWRKGYKAAKAALAEAEAAREKQARDARRKAHNDKLDARFDEIAARKGNENVEIQ